MKRILSMCLVAVIMMSSIAGTFPAQAFAYNEAANENTASEVFSTSEIVEESPKDKAAEATPEDETAEVNAKDEADEVKAKDEADEVKAKDEADEVKAKDEADEVKAKNEADEATPKDEADEVKAKNEADEATPKDEAAEATPKDEAAEATPKDEADAVKPEGESNFGGDEDTLLEAAVEKRNELNAADAKALVPIDEENFPDATFRYYISEHIDGDGDQKLSEDEILRVSSINIERGGALNLKGIEHFSALTELSCSKNWLTSLDLSKNTALTELSCDDNMLTSLDVSKNTALHRLHCSRNQLTGLDVSKNTALTELYCDDNMLTSLDVSKNTALANLICGGNRLTSLDLSKNTALHMLHCSRNQLTGLDVSKNTALADLICYENQLTGLDLSKNTALAVLFCYENQLTGLDLSKNTALTVLYCNENQLTGLDVSKNTALCRLHCSRNQLTSLDLSHNTELSHTHCSPQSYRIPQRYNFDYSKLPDDFDAGKVRNPEGVTFDAVNHTLSVPSGHGTYEYDTGKTGQSNLMKVDLEADLGEFVVRFDTDGGTQVPAQTITFGGKVTKPADPTKENHVFLDWEVTADPADMLGKSWDFDTDVVPAEDITLTAIWTDQVNVIYHYNGAAFGEDVSGFYQIGGLLPEPQDVVLEDNVVLEGWYLEPTFETRWDFTNDKVPAHNMELYAKFEAKERTVTFDPQNAAAPTTQKVKVGHAIARPTPDPVKDGYTFDGWYDETGMKWDFDAMTMPNNDITLHAKWILHALALNHAPIIHAEDVVLTVGDTFDPLENVAAYDTEDGDIALTDENIKESNVDLDVAGIYHITYVVTDSQGASAQRMIAVTVKEKQAPVNPDKPVNPSKPNIGDNVPNTGDMSNLGLYSAMLVCSVGALAFLSMKKRKGQ